MIDGDQHLLGVMTRYDILNALEHQRNGEGDNIQLSQA